jgi:hypothetical protein
LCTTEVSVGLFIEVVLGTQKWAEVDKLLPSEKGVTGIRVWGRQQGAITLSRAWVPELPSILEVPSVPTGKLYPVNAIPEALTASHPMQHVSLAAAVYFSRLLNCRPPAFGEWEAAYEADKLVRSPKPYNLRDKTWQVQRDHAASLEKSGDLLDAEGYYPDAGIFWPKGTPNDQRKTASQAEVAPNAQTDGYVWFAKVNYDDQRIFQHLVGNVAEYVYDDSDSVLGLKPVTGDGVLALLKGAGAAAAARVVGGSAMSTPSMPVDKPQELPSVSGTEGFSDVGFRLAFLAGREPLQSSILRLLKGLANQGYLPAASP